MDTKSFLHTNATLIGKQKKTTIVSGITILVFIVILYNILFSSSSNSLHFNLRHGSSSSYFPSNRFVQNYIAHSPSLFSSPPTPPPPTDDNNYLHHHSPRTPSSLAALLPLKQYESHIIKSRTIAFDIIVQETKEDTKIIVISYFYGDAIWNFIEDVKLYISEPIPDPNSNGSDEKMICDTTNYEMGVWVPVLVTLEEGYNEYEPFRAVEYSLKKQKKSKYSEFVNKIESNKSIEQLCVRIKWKENKKEFLLPRETYGKYTSGIFSVEEKKIPLLLRTQRL